MRGRYYRFEGKLAFVTGSTKGIGQTPAMPLLREGARVIIHGRTKESVEHAPQGLANRGEPAVERHQWREPSGGWRGD
jgi:NAD(P)-dependent dehydrogenase (short-subunit alcohol dehydrogenase family)